MLLMNSLEFLRDLTMLFKQKYEAYMWFKFDELFSDVLIIRVDTLNGFHFTHDISLERLNTLTSSEQKPIADYIISRFEDGIKRLRGDE